MGVLVFLLFLGEKYIQLHLLSLLWMYLPHRVYIFSLDYNKACGVKKAKCLQRTSPNIQKVSDIWFQQLFQSLQRYLIYQWIKKKKKKDKQVTDRNCAAGRFFHILFKLRQLQTWKIYAKAMGNSSIWSLWGVKELKKKTEPVSLWGTDACLGIQMLAASEACVAKWMRIWVQWASQERITTNLPACGGTDVEEKSL